jgi:hypothetical protein
MELNSKPIPEAKNQEEECHPSGSTDLKESDHTDLPSQQNNDGDQDDSLSYFMSISG